MNSPNEEIHLRDYWRVLMKRRRIAVPFFAIVVVVVAVYSFVATPVYQGTVQLLVDNERNQTLNFSDSGTAVIQQKDMAEYLNTQKTIISSRIFADRVARKLQLDKNSYFKELKEKGKNSLKSTIISTMKRFFPERVKPDGALADFKFREELDPFITDVLLKNLTLKTEKKSNILIIQYTAKDPSVAAGLANGIAVAFIEHNLDIKVKPYRDAAEWLSSRLVESKSKVSETETHLQQYREGKGIVSFESGQNVINQKLQELMTQLVETEGKRHDAEIKYRQIQSVIDKPELLATVPDIMNNLVIQGLRTDELALRRQLSDLSEKYGAKHPQLIKMQSQLEMVKRNINLEARKMLSAAKADYDVAYSREHSLRQAVEGQKREVLDLTRKAIDFNVIAGESGSNKQFYDLLLKRLQEASLTGGMSVSNIQIVDNATVPQDPLKPQKGKNLLLALLLGLFGGISAAFFIEYMDDTIKTAEDVDKALGLPLLDIVPLTNLKEGPLFVLSNTTSATAESFRTIRTGIMLSTLDEDPLKVLLVTSAIPNEGKSTVATNLAVAMSQMGERVLLIDVDMRRHNLHEFFASDNSTGISDLIIDPLRLPEAIKKIEGVPNLSLITGGTLAPNPSELIGSDRMKKLIGDLRGQYDRIILDSPPLMAFSDSLLLSRLSDGVIMVAWGAKTPRGTIIKAADLLKGVNARILGLVLNKIDTVRHQSYAYYSYYYSDSKGSKKNRT